MIPEVRVPGSQGAGSTTLLGARHLAVRVRRPAGVTLATEEDVMCCIEQT
jgi:hypothetical protein